MESFTLTIIKMPKYINSLLFFKIKDLIKLVNETKKYNDAFKCPFTYENFECTLIYENIRKNISPKEIDILFVVIIKKSFKKSITNLLTKKIEKLIRSNNINKLKKIEFIYE